MDREVLWTSVVLGLMRSALSNAVEVETGTASGVLSPLAATLKGSGLKQANVRAITNHGSYYMLEKSQRGGAGEGPWGRGRPRPQGAGQAGIGARPRTLSGRISGRGSSWGLLLLGTYLFIPPCSPERV